MLLQAPGHMKSDKRMDDSAQTIPDPGMKYDPEGGFQKNPDQVLDKPAYVGEHSANWPQHDASAQQTKQV